MYPWTGRLIKGILKLRGKEYDLTQIKGINVLYGDIGDPEILDNLQIEKPGSKYNQNKNQNAVPDG